LLKGDDKIVIKSVRFFHKVKTDTHAPKVNQGNEVQGGTPSLSTKKEQEAHAHKLEERERNNSTHH